MNERRPQRTLHELHTLRERQGTTPDIQLEREYFSAATREMAHLVEALSKARQYLLENGESTERVDQELETARRDLEKLREITRDLGQSQETTDVSYAEVLQLGSNVFRVLMADLQKMIGHYVGTTARVAFAPELYVLSQLVAARDYYMYLWYQRQERKKTERKD